MRFLMVLLEFVIAFIVLKAFEEINYRLKMRDVMEAEEISPEDLAMYYPRENVREKTVLSLRLPEADYKREFLDFANEFPDHVVDCGFESTRFSADEESYEDWLKKVVDDAEPETVFVVTETGRIVGIMNINALHEDGDEDSEAERLHYQIRPSELGNAYDGFSLLLYAQFIIDCYNRDSETDDDD